MVTTENPDKIKVTIANCVVLCYIMYKKEKKEMKDYLKILSPRKC